MSNPNDITDDSQLIVTLINDDCYDNNITDDFIMRVQSTFDMTDTETENNSSLHNTNHQEYDNSINRIQMNTNFAKSVDYEINPSIYSGNSKLEANNKTKLKTAHLNLYSFEIINSLEPDDLLEKYSKKLLKVALKIEVKSFVKHFVKSYINDLKMKTFCSVVGNNKLTWKLNNDSIINKQIKNNEYEFDNILIVDSEIKIENSIQNNNIYHFNLTEREKCLYTQSTNNLEDDHERDELKNQKTHRAIGTSPIHFQSDDNNKKLFRSLNCISRQNSQEKVPLRKLKSTSHSLLYRIFNRDKSKSKPNYPAYFTKTYSKDTNYSMENYVSISNDQNYSDKDDISNVWSENETIESNKSLDTFHRPSSCFDKVKSTFQSSSKSTDNDNSAVLVIE